MKNHYFIVLDEAPIRGHPTPKYDLLFGNIETVIGTHVHDRHNDPASAYTMKELLYLVPKNENVYRVYLRRTDGKTGYKIIGKGRKSR